MGRKVFVIGVGLTIREAVFARLGLSGHGPRGRTMALQDAGVSFDSVEQACVGYVFGDSTRGQHAVYELGLTGITGSSGCLHADSAVGCRALSALCCRRA